MKQTNSNNNNNSIQFNNNNNNNNNNSVVLVCERTIPTERRPLVGEVSANFCRKSVHPTETEHQLPDRKLWTGSNIWSKAPKWARLQDVLTDSRKVTSTMSVPNFGATDWGIGEGFPSTQRYYSSFYNLFIHLTATRSGRTTIFK
jgi:hypothetical protein